jgi:hypothetical protein
MSCSYSGQELLRAGVILLVPNVSPVRQRELVTAARETYRRAGSGEDNGVGPIVAGLGYQLEVRQP